MENEKIANKRNAKIIENLERDAEKALRRGHKVEFLSQWGSCIRRNRRSDLNWLPFPYYHSIWIDDREKWENVDSLSEPELIAYEKFEETMRRKAEKENYRLVLDEVEKIADEVGSAVQEVAIGDDVPYDDKFYLMPPDLYHRILVWYKGRSVSLLAWKTTAYNSYEREGMSASFKLLNEDRVRTECVELVDSTV